MRLAPEGSRRRVVLLGNPNVGKSVLFGKLTGSYVTVSNYPGTTVEVTRGHARLGDGATATEWDVVDTPGTNNLVPMSDDEAVTRTIVMNERHDAIVQVGDAKALSRVILLTLQLRETHLPFRLVLNMFDELRARRVAIDLKLLSARLGVEVHSAAALVGEGVDAIRASIPAAPASFDARELAAVTLPEDVELAIENLARSVEATPSNAPRVVPARAIAIALLSGDAEPVAGLPLAIGEQASQLRTEIARAHGMPAFALLNRARLQTAQRIVREVQHKVAASAESRTPVGWARSLTFGLVAALLGGFIVDGAAALLATAPAQGDALASYGVGAIVRRVTSVAALQGWTRLGLFYAVACFAIATATARRSLRLRSTGWKLIGAWCVGYVTYFVASAAEQLLRGKTGGFALGAGALVAIATLTAGAFADEQRDLAFTQRLGALTMRPIAGLPFLAASLLIAYQIVGAFGAGTAVDWLENDVFGQAVATAKLSGTSVSAPDNADDGTRRLVVTALTADSYDVRAEVKNAGAWALDGTVALTTEGARTTLHAAGHVVVEHATGRTVKAWSGKLNALAQRGLDRIGIRAISDFFVGPYGLLTMGLTYAIAIVLPVVTTFFFVFSILEDSGYLPRLAVMANRGMRVIGLNGKAVLPMILGLGCDTMATLTARVLESKKERVLTTLLLALAIPCSSQLTVVFALMQSVSWRATALWVSAMIATLLVVGWTAARVIPGDRSDFVLEVPPIRRPEIRNVATKTLARIEWYLKEAVPLFLVGSLLLYTLDLFHLLPFVHKMGEPAVHYVLGFPRGGNVSDKVSEALLVGFLRRDFGAAGLLDLARHGALSAADVAVSMVVITLFIPCIANVFMIVKERGWKTAALMAGFIFPYALFVGAIVRRIMGH